MKFKISNLQIEGPDKYAPKIMTVLNLRLLLAHTMYEKATQSPLWVAIYLTSNGCLMFSLLDFLVGHVGLQHNKKCVYHVFFFL